MNNELLYLRGMQFMKYLSLVLVALLIGSCFFPWVLIGPKEIMISGFRSDTPVYGKPGLFHVFMSGLYLIFLLLGKAWSTRLAFFITALNIAWALRNFVSISACSGGECPVKQPALYVLLVSSVLLLVTTLFAYREKPVAS
jgi:hypothetical protein